MQVDEVAANRTRRPKANEGRCMISVVVPVYNECDNVQPMYEALRVLAEAQADMDWEFVFVEDGSADDTFERLAAINGKNGKLVLVGCNDEDLQVFKTNPLMKTFGLRTD